MSNIGIIIQCRDNSTRLKNKSVRPFWEGKSMLEIIYNRFQYLPYPTIVATSFYSNIAMRICKEIGAHYFVGSEDNVARRLYNAATWNKFTGFFRVCADNPFVQLPLMYPIKAWVEGDDDYIAFRGSMRRHEGFFLEYIDTAALGRMLEMNPTKLDLEHVTPYIRRNPKKFKIRLLDIPPILNELPIRLTVDTKSDFYIARKVYKHMKDSYWVKVIEYIYDNPAIVVAMFKNRRGNPKICQ